MKIMLDAGHGNNTPGKRSPDGTLREFQYNSAVAKLVKSALEAYENVEVVYANDITGAVDTPLSQRTAAANNAKADAYISIHANAAGDGWSTGNGIETFHHTKLNVKSKELATTIQRKLIEKTGRRDRGVKQADFQVLRETTMPAILIEGGFMTHKEEAELLKSDAYRKLCADAIVEGVAEYFKLKKKADKPAAVASTDKPSEWFAKSWEKATVKGVFDGKNPQGAVTREMLAELFNRLGLLD